MVDLIGPGDAGAINTLSTTTDVVAPVAGDTWFQDCVGGDATAGTPTPIVAKWLNWQLQQLRVSMRKSSVPLANNYDNMLSWAMQSGAANWAGTFGGTANALTGTAPNAPLGVQVGTLIRGKASAANTGAATFNWAGLGAQPITHIDGSALSGGEIAYNQRVVLMWDGAAWVLITPAPGWLISQLSAIDIQQFDLSGTWNRPAGFADAARVTVELWGGGGGGVGGNGGCGGAYDRFEFYLGQLPSSASVVVGAGGVGSNNTSGTVNAATAGGASYFLYGLYGNKFTTPGALSVLQSSLSTGLHAMPNFVPDYVGGGGAALIPGFPPSGGSAFYGGAAGAGWNGSAGTPGTSIFGGNGGAAGSPGANGSAPGGGGGAGASSPSPAPCTPGGNGANGRVIVTTIMG
jgi:hypothetical protein